MNSITDVAENTTKYFPDIEHFVYNKIATEQELLLFYNEKEINRINNILENKNNENINNKNIKYSILSSTAIVCKSIDLVVCEQTFNTFCCISHEGCYIINSISIILKNNNNNEKYL